MSTTDKRHPKKKRRLKVGRLIILVLVFSLFIVGGAGIGFMVGVIKNMPDYDPGNYNPDLSTNIYDNQDKLFGQLRGAENRIWADFNEIPETVKEAFLATEDHRFYSHFGVDLEGIARSIVANIRHGYGSQGASTITQQLARNAFIGSKEKKMERKIQEAILAIKLERMYTKDEIFEFYLNHIYFGAGASGIKAAAQTFFNKDLNELTLAESATLAGQVQRPASTPFNNPERAMARRNTVLSLMVRHGYISEEEANAAKQEEFNLNEDRQKLQENFPWFTDYVIKEGSMILESLGIEPVQLFTGGLSVYTTMDTTMQTKLEELYSDPKNFPPNIEDVIVESAAIFLNHNTGEIKALVGGRELVTRRGLNRATDMKRQPGSSIKPIVAYAPALEMGYSPATVLDDAPVEFPSVPKPYSPVNYDGRFRGLITMRAAIKDSVNIPAVKMLHQIGVNTGFEFGKKLGLPLLESDKNLSLALGGLTEGVSPLDMARAYGAFANQGILVEPYTIRKILDKDGQVLYEANPNKTVVMSEQTAYLMTDMLITAVESGTGTRARLGNRPAAGKTGTTQLPAIPQFANVKGNRDAWFVGYTPEYTGAVWMGFDETTVKHYLRSVYGGQLPASIWKQTMETGLKNQPIKDFTKPNNLAYIPVDAKSGLMPSDLTPSQYIINEIFTRNNVPKDISTAWIEAPICAETGQRPSAYCPDVVNGIFLQRPVPYEPPPSRPGVYPEDWGLQYPSEVCSIHGPGTHVTVYLCEDERHRGVPYLAILPKEGYIGGCPSDVITQRSFPANEVPKDYCPLPDHQLTIASSSADDHFIDNDEAKLDLKLEFIKDNNNNMGVLLVWNSLGPDITYNVYRWENNNAKRLLGSTTDTSFLDETVNTGKNYKYQVIAGNRESKTQSIQIKSNN